MPPATLNTCPLCGDGTKVFVEADEGVIIAKRKVRRLTVHQADILQRLLRQSPNTTPMETLLAAAGNASSLRDHIQNIREIVRPLGMRIHNSWGRGYALVVGEGV